MVKLSGTRKDMAKQRVRVGALEIDGVDFHASHDAREDWFVSSVTGASTNDGKSVDGARATLASVLNDAALAANDRIWLMPGHVETVIAAAGLDVDTAGLTIYFLGNGANKAYITFTTDVGADMDIDAANVTLVEPLFVAGIDALTGPIDVNSADFTIYDGEWRDAAAIGTTDCIVADANADRMLIDGWRYVDSTTGTQKQSNIQVAGAEDIVIRNFDIVGDFDTGAIENGTAWANALLEHGVINNTAPGPVVGILLQGTSTGTMWDVNIRVASGTTYLTADNDMQFFECFGTGTDATAGEKIGTQLAGDVEAKVDVIDGYFDVPTADATTDATIRDVVGRKTDTASSVVVATDSLMSYIKGLINSNGQIVSKAFADTSASLTTGLSPVTTFTVTGDVMVQVWGVVGGTAITSTLNNGTLSVGTAEDVDGIIAATTMDGSDFDATDVWVDNDPANDVKAVGGSGAWYVVGGGADIVIAIATNSSDAGVLTMYCRWMPVSAGATVVAA